MPWELRMTLIFSSFGLVIYLYVGYRLTKSFSLFFPLLKSKFKITLIILLAFLNLLPITILFYALIGNIKNFFTSAYDLSVPDYLILYPFWIGFIFIIELLPYFLSIDIFQIVLKKIRTKYKENLIRYLAILRFALVFFLLVFVIFRSDINTNTIKNSKHTITIPGLPDNLKNLNLSLIGDIHIDRYTQENKINQFHQKIKSCNPDLILSTGDVISRGNGFIKQGLETLCNTEAGIARIACMGDHDHWYGASQIMNGLKSCGWEFLYNQHHVINYKDSKILITGITYIYSKRISYGSINNLLSEAPEADLKILIVHQPARTVVEAAKKYGYHLLLAGHTHGGQIVFHPFGIPLTPTQSENQFYSGYHKLDNLNLFVTNGIGLTLAPLRYGAPAEITKIILH